MRIALTGASGFIGSVIARHAAEAGHQVTALVRTTSRRDHVEPFVDRFVVGDQDDAGAWPDLLDGADVLVHDSVDWRVLKQGDVERHLRSNLVGALRLIDVAAPRPVVFMSTIAVHHDMRPRWQGRIDEDHPMRPGGRYGAAKAAVEAHLWSMLASERRSFVALRPCAVYGVDPNLARSIGFPFVKTLREGSPFTRPGGGKFVHVDDVARATMGAIDRVTATSNGTEESSNGGAEPIGIVANMADCYARWSDLAHMIADALGIDDATIDDSSPAQPKNVFDKEVAKSLGADMDRGHDGLRAYLEDLLVAMGETVSS